MSKKKSGGTNIKATATKSAKTKRLSKTSLVAFASELSNPAVIHVIFQSGLGQITSTLFRNGILINLQSISNSGSINFSDVQSGDSVSLNGVCSGTADITISVPTNPPTPEHFDAGIIMTGYTIL